jgi:hypothetical protein
LRSGQITRRLTRFSALRLRQPLRLQMVLPLRMALQPREQRSEMRASPEGRRLELRPNLEEQRLEMRASPEGRQTLLRGLCIQTKTYQKGGGVETGGVETTPYALRQRQTAA